MCIALPVVRKSVKKPKSPEILPGDLAIWILIYAELLAFGVFFVTYIVIRSQNIELFNESQLILDKRLGLLNTLVLLTSSFFVVKAVRSIKRDEKNNTAFWLFASIVTGLIFIISKIYEFSIKSDEGINLSTNAFYTYYFSMTAFHFMHVVLGLLLLSVVLIKTKLGGYSSNNHLGIETVASYWHMVDLVWIVLFPLVYLIR